MSRLPFAESNRGVCPRCGSHNVRHLMIGLISGPEKLERLPDWVSYLGCMHPGHLRECDDCGVGWGLAGVSSEWVWTYQAGYQDMEYLSDSPAEGMEMFDGYVSFGDRHAARIRATSPTEALCGARLKYVEGWFDPAVFDACPACRELAEHRQRPS